jgi:hypothetical protein
MYKLESIVGVSGKFCSGKDTLAIQLVERGLGERRALADLLKGDVYDLLRRRLSIVSLDEKVGWVNANKKSLRTLLQEYGAACREMYGEDYWVERLQGYCSDNGIRRIVVPDVRYPNEVRGLCAISEHFYCVRLTAPEAVLDGRYRKVYGVEPSLSQKGHHSETALDNTELTNIPGEGFDIIIDTHVWKPEAVLNIALADMEYMGVPVGA